MTYVYYIDGEKFIDENYEFYNNNFLLMSSPNEETPAFEELEIGYKFWCLKGFIWHRLTGPAFIDYFGNYNFYLNGIYYKNLNDWLKDNPNQDNTFQIEMLLKYS
jgi:hypothetical protein